AFPGRADQRLPDPKPLPAVWLCGMGGDADGRNVSHYACGGRFLLPGNTKAIARILYGAPGGESEVRNGEVALLETGPSKDALATMSGVQRPVGGVSSGQCASSLRGRTGGECRAGPGSACVRRGDRGPLR